MSKKNKPTKSALTPEEKDRIVTSALRSDPEIQAWQKQVEGKEQSLARKLDEADKHVMEKVRQYTMNGLILPPAESFNRLVEAYREVLHFGSWTKEDMEVVLSTYMATAIISKMS